MTDEDDLAQLGPRLATVDLDTEAADRIRRLGRDGVIYGAPLTRFVLPAMTAIVTTSYATWALLKLLEVYR